ncbi:MAG: hypothetical protein E7172_02470 [Firmicutes bacterium]|nr:hypothetical protein [Bacillota bacterium]
MKLSIGTVKLVNGEELLIYENGHFNIIRNINTSKKIGIDDLVIIKDNKVVEVIDEKIAELINLYQNRLIKKWYFSYELAKIYFAFFGNLEIPYNFKTFDGISFNENGYSLYSWVETQRKNMRNNNLSEDKKRKLGELDFRINDKREEKWQKMYELAKSFYQFYKHLEVNGKFKTFDGITFDESGFALGNWISAQRQSEKNGWLDEERKNLLSEIGMRFNLNRFEEKWFNMYELAKNYCNFYGNLDINYHFKTLNGFSYDESGFALGKWFLLQTTNYENGILNERRISLISALHPNFLLEINDDNWFKYYDLAKKYFSYHEHLAIPEKYKTLNGFAEDLSGYPLGVWLRRQRQDYQKGLLNEEKVALLNEINFNEQQKFLKWLKMYELAKNYYEFHGNLEMPHNFKTINGFEYDESGFALGLWLTNQRQQYKNNKLIPEQKDLLSKIAMRFETNYLEIKWQKIYELAKKYYEINNNLEIPKDFITLDGYTYDESGFELGRWLYLQKLYQQRSSLTKQKALLLEHIGIIWLSKSHLNRIKSICQEYNINYKLNKIILKNISYQELLAKIFYLNNINHPLVNEFGYLHEIFRISNINLQLKYQISLEEIINNYFNTYMKERIK